MISDGESISKPQRREQKRGGGWWGRRREGKKDGIFGFFELKQDVIFYMQVYYLICYTLHM